MGISPDVGDVSFGRERHHSWRASSANPWMPSSSISSPSSVRIRPEKFPKTWWVSEPLRSEEHTSELQSLMRISYAVFCLKKKKIEQKKKQNESENTIAT